MSASPSLMEMFAELIAAPSVSSVSPEFDMGNGAVIDLLEDWLCDLGFTTERVTVDEAPEKSNLIAVLGNAEAGGGLVLSGHTDTVPYDAHLWKHDPLRLTESEGKLYGLGTSDMKGFLAIAIEAAKAYVETKLKAPLIILATADEESTMNGAQRLTELGRPRGRYAVIGEPTGLTPIRMHKGVAMEALTLVGRSGHSSNPALGINALDGMHTALGVIKDWRRELAETHRHEGFEVPIPTLNLGHIHGGDNPNRICGHCELHFDMRLLPGMQVDQLRPLLRERLDRALSDTGLELHMRNLDVEIPAFEEPAQSELVAIMERLSGRASKSVAFGSEAPFLQRLGMQTVVWGPGDIEQAHQPDEFLLAERIPPTLETLKKLISEICCS